MRHFESKAMWEEAIVRSGKARSLRKVNRIEESRLRRFDFERFCDSRYSLPPIVYMLYESTGQGKEGPGLVH